MKSMQWQSKKTVQSSALAVIIHGGKIFMGLIFVVKGTHKNFNTTKISVSTVSTYRVYMYVHVHVQCTK